MKPQLRPAPIELEPNPEETVPQKEASSPSTKDEDMSESGEEVDTSSRRSSWRSAVLKLLPDEDEDEEMSKSQDDDAEDFIHDGSHKNEPQDEAANRLRLIAKETEKLFMFCMTAERVMTALGVQFFEFPLSYHAILAQPADMPYLSTLFRVEEVPAEFAHLRSMVNEQGRQHPAAMRILAGMFTLHKDLEAVLGQHDVQLAEDLWETTNQIGRQLHSTLKHIQSILLRWTIDVDIDRVELESGAGIPQLDIDKYACQNVKYEVILEWVQGLPTSRALALCDVPKEQIYDLTMFNGPYGPDQVDLGEWFGDQDEVLTEYQESESEEDAMPGAELADTYAGSVTSESSVDYDSDIAEREAPSVESYHSEYEHGGYSPSEQSEKSDHEPSATSGAEDCAMEDLTWTIAAWT